MKSRIIDFQPAMEEIISKCETCCMSMVDQNNQPYGIPMNFGLKDHTLYLHSGPEGQKMAILKNNPAVCLSFSTDHKMRIQHEDVACSYSMRYRSVLVFGQVEFIEDLDQKAEALNVIMKQYSDRDNFKYSEPALKNVRVMKVNVNKMEGKAFGY